MSIQRMYLKGWQQGDFARGKPHLHLIEPIIPDVQVVTQGGLYIPGKQIEAIPGNAALMFRVVKAAEPRDPEEVRCSDGDVVVVRNGLVDLIHPNGRLAVLDTKHVLLVVDPAATAIDALPPPLTLDQLAAMRAADESPVAP